jgi:hypothetical protein
MYSIGDLAIGSPRSEVDAMLDERNFSEIHMWAMQYSY